MRRFRAIALLTVLLLLFAAGCKTVSTTILNTESKLFYGGSQLETTVRELMVDGGKTTARIRFLNLGTEELDSIEALVQFIDQNGTVIAEDVISETFSSPVPVGESFSETAQCKSDSDIVGVYVTEYVPGS